MVVGRIAGIVGVKQLQERRAVYRRYDYRKSKRIVKDKLDDAELGVNGPHTYVSVLMRRLAESPAFQYLVLVAVIAGSVVVGANTYGLNRDPVLGMWIALVDEVVIGVLVGEVVVKIVAEGRRPLEYFHDRWNLLDCFIAVVSVVSLISGSAGKGTQTVIGLRVVRLLRVLKLMRIVPKMRILVMALVASLASIAYIGLLLVLLFYFYGIIGTTAFGANDPRYFGSLHVSILTLFRVATLEDWSDAMYIQIHGCDRYGYEALTDECTQPQASPAFSVLYFLSFVVVSAYMILNMFIGVIMSSLEDARKHLTHEWNAEEAEKREQQKTSKLPSFLQGKGRRHSFVGSALDKPSEFDEQREATERLIEMRDVVAKVKDDVGYVRTVELDRWVRREEYRVHQNIIKLRKVKQLARGVAALGGARKRRRGSMVARLAPSSPEGSLMRAGAKVRRASFGSLNFMVRRSSRGLEEEGSGEQAPSPKQSFFRRLSLNSQSSHSDVGAVGTDAEAHAGSSRSLSSISKDDNRRAAGQRAVTGQGAHYVVQGDVEGADEGSTGT